MANPSTFVRKYFYEKLCFYEYVFISLCHHIIIRTDHHIIIRSIEQKLKISFGPKSTQKNFNGSSTPSPRNVETWTFGEMGSFFKENLMVTLKRLQLSQNEEIMGQSQNFFWKFFNKKNFLTSKNETSGIVWNAFWPSLRPIGAILGG